jgi:hypothetical protein
LLRALYKTRPLSAPYLSKQVGFDDGIRKPYNNIPIAVIQEAAKELGRGSFLIIAIFARP